VWGDNWYDTIVSAKMNGVPPAQLIAAEIQKVRDESRAERSQWETQQREAAERAQAEAAQRQLRDFRAAAVADAERRADELPALMLRLGDAKAVGEAVGSHIRARWDATAKQAEDGTYSGTLLTFEEAAKELEEREVELLKKLTAHEKLKTRLTPPKNPDSVSSSLKQQSAQSTQQPRRTLSNDLTGSTPGRQPPATTAEKRARAIAAFNQLRKAT